MRAAARSGERGSRGPPRGVHPDDPVRLEAHRNAPRREVERVGAPVAAEHPRGAEGRVPRERSSRSGVKMRTRASPGRSSRTNVVSEKFISRAMACMLRESRWAQSRTTASWLPASGRSANTSTIEQRMAGPRSVSSIPFVPRARCDSIKSTAPSGPRQSGSTGRRAASRAQRSLVRARGHRPLARDRPLRETDHGSVAALHPAARASAHSAARRRRS